MYCLRHPQLRRLDSTNAVMTAALEMVQVTGGCEGVAVTRMLDEVLSLHLLFCGTLAPRLLLSVKPEPSHCVLMTDMNLLLNVIHEDAHPYTWNHENGQVFALLVQVLGAGMDTIRKLAKLDEPKASGRAAGRPGGVGGAGGSNAQTQGSGEGGAGSEDDMSLIDDDDTAVLEAEDLSMMWMALQCAIGVLRLTERLPAFLADVEASLQQLILDYGPLIFGPVSLTLSGQEGGVGSGTGVALQCRYLLGEARRMAALEKLITKAKGKDFVALVRGPSLLQV